MTPAELPTDATGTRGSDDSGVFLSVVIPAFNEQWCVRETVEAILDELRAREIHDFEILIVNDNSSDGTEAVLQSLAAVHPQVTYLNNDPPHGFGFAVRRGLEAYRGETVCLMMADLSDSPADLCRYYDALKGGAECVFGSRFIRGSLVTDYPKFKLTINRLANWFIRMLFGLQHNDITNAFKAYRREVIDGVQPLLSHHFNLTVELPLKAVIRGYNFVTMPISWRNRTAGTSKLQLKEMGSRYLFIVLYAFLEKLLSKGDYRRLSPVESAPIPAGKTSAPFTSAAGDE